MEKLVEQCVKDCFEIASDMVKSGVAKGDAAVQAVDCILDEPIYLGSEIDYKFKVLVRERVVELLNKEQ